MLSLLILATILYGIRNGGGIAKAEIFVAASGGVWLRNDGMLEPGTYRLVVETLSAEFLVGHGRMAEFDNN